MSRLAIDECGNALQALQSIFRSDRFKERDIATSSAMLSQQGTPVEKQDDIMVLKHMLNVWGIGFDSAISNDDVGTKTWMYDSITFLTTSLKAVASWIMYVLPFENMTTGFPHRSASMFMS